ncbi:hypothetical protein M5E87_04605 [Flavonifractor plautii]|nr:hypothetical protein M5E87_04605 [Flavonifractor plautii]
MATPPPLTPRCRAKAWTRSTICSSRPLTHIWRRSENCETTAGAVGGLPGAGSGCLHRPGGRGPHAPGGGHSGLDGGPSSGGAPSRTGWRTSKRPLSWTRSSRRSSCGRTAPPASSWAAPPAAWTAIPGRRRSAGAGDYETVTLDSGWTYLVAQGRYARWEDFQAMLDGIFTPAYQEELLWTENMDGERFPIFTADGEGRTCFLELEQGSSLEYGWADVPDTYELVSQSEDAVEFYLVGHYADLTVQPDETGARPLSTERWPIRMERTAGGWRVSEFHVPY